MSFHSSFSKSTTLELLQKRSINLIAPENIEHINDIRIYAKPQKLEEVFVNGIADAPTGFRIRSSTKNSRITRSEYEEPRNMFLVCKIINFGEAIT